MIDTGLLGSYDFAKNEPPRHKVIQTPASNQHLKVRNFFLLEKLSFQLIMNR